MNQLNIFTGKRILIGPPPTDDLLRESHEIVSKAIIDSNPYAICLMLSGGDDSITALLVAIRLGVKIDYIIHGVTGTGLPIVRKYVHSIADKFGIPILEADAKDKFQKYVLRKGFFGRGVAAHTFSYHLLKARPFRTAVSQHLRKNHQGRNIILLNGVRVEESENRADNFGDNPYRWDEKRNYWVNIIHWWTKAQCLDFIKENGIERNPASVALGRSCECNCGTMQSSADLIAAAEFDPIWGGAMMDLRKAVVAKHGWDISTQPNKKQMAEVKAKAEILTDFMPMCVGCKARQQSLFY